MILWICIVVWVFPSIFAILTDYRRKADMIMFNLGLGWFPPFWGMLVMAVWEEWEWWKREKPGDGVVRLSCGCSREEVLRLKYGGRTQAKGADN